MKFYFSLWHTLLKCCTARKTWAVGRVAQSGREYEILMRVSDTCYVAIQREFTHPFLLNIFGNYCYEQYAQPRRVYVKRGVGIA